MATARALGAGALLSALSAMRAAAGTYYVDQANPAASTAGPGTESSPYSTIASAVSARAAAGNTIIVKAGTYREQVSLPASGTALAPIVLRAQGTVIVDGADDFSNPAKWSAGAGGVYLAASVTWSPKQVIVGGTRLTASTDSTSALLLNTFRYVAGAGLYVNAGGANPGASSTSVGRRASAFVVGGRSWITIEGFTALRPDDRAFNLSSGASDLVIAGNTVRYSAKYGMYLSDCHRVRVASNTLSDNGHHGLMLTNATSNCTIEDNESCRNAAPDLRVANGVHLYSATANVIRRNRWHDNQDSGQHLQSGSNDNISSNNISWNNGDHGFDHLGATGTLHLNDVAYGNAMDGFSVEGASTGTRLANCIAAENGLASTEYDLWVDNSSLTGFSSNDNLFWNSTPQKPVKLGATSYALVSAYAAATGQDTRSLQADPRFIAAATGNFSLLADSPAIDNGNSSDPNWPATDQQGRERADFDAVPNAGLGPVAWSDRGALEYQPGGVPPVAALSVSPAASLAPAVVTLDASGSSDANGTVVSYRFDFGDGTSAGPQPGATITHTYAAGSFEAVVTVTDDQGLTAQAAAMVFANRVPVAALGVSPAAGRSPLAVQLDASSSFDLDGRVTSYEFDFGDGATSGPQASPLATHSYGTGLWRARLRIVDDRGAVDTLDAPVALTVGGPNSPPSAELTASPVSGPARLKVTFDASGSSDPDGGIATYEFFFGDGTSSGALTVPRTTHMYSGGQFTARVVVTDVDGATATRSLTVFVTTANLSPNGDILTPVAEAVTVSAGQSVSFTSVASDPDGHLPLRYAWDFGGTGTSTLANPGSVVFPNVGTFFVTLRVSDALDVSDPTPDTCRVTVVAPDTSQAADQLHWTMSGPTSVTINWRGPLGTLSYGLTDAYGTNVNAVAPVPLPWSSTGPFWEARIDGLAVNTTYHYAVAGGTDHTFRTPPARGSSGFTVVAEGDIGSAADYPNVAGVQAMVASQNPAFVLAVGDLSYANENGIAACDRFFNDMMAWSTDAAFMPIWGNHEWEKDFIDDLRNYKGRFELPNPQTTPGIPAPNDGGEDWYWFDHGNVRFIAYPEPFSGALDDWYPRARVLMQAAQADPAIAFVVTFGHRPAYSSGRHPGEPRLQGYLDQLGASFPKYVLNLNGHSHNYERSLPNWGVVHVTAGASGSPLEQSGAPAGGCKWDGGCPAPAWSAYRVMHQGVLRLRFTSGGIEGTYLAGPSATGEDTTVALGSVLDHFIIGTPAQDQAPVVTVPATADVNEGGLLSLEVSAADADGDAVLSLSADLSRLPAGNDAAFTPAPDHTSGVLTWHPTFADAGSHLVTFTASNALAGSAPTTVLVHQQDRPPVVSVADTAYVVAEGSTLSIEALAEDPDADAVASLVMHISPEPEGIAPSFESAPGFSSTISGTLQWVPDFADSGEYRVTFTATNSLAAHREVRVRVLDVDRAPIVIAPAALTVMGAGSLDFTVLASDPDGGAIESFVADLAQLPAGNSATFDIAADHRSATFHWTPGASVTGTFTLRFTAANALSGATSTVLSVNHADHAPVVSAPDTVWVAEGELLRFGVSVSDPDSTAIGGLSADLSGLPANHGAQWNVTPDQRNLTFQWTTGFTHAGTYALRWTATNALSAIRSTVVRVLQSDRPPIVTAPAARTGSAAAPIAIDVTAVDPDGEAIASLTADLTGLPAAHSAWFTAGADARSGTFHWTPAAADTGSYLIVFRAANSIAGLATTLLQVSRPNSGPTANLSVNTSTGIAPLNVTADASASSDAEGPIVSYRFAFGDGTLAGPQSSPVVSHVYAPGVWPLSVTVTDQSGAVHTRQVTITVAAAGPGPNLCGNPSFEANTTGWNSFGSAGYQRVPGGFSGSSAVELTGTGGTLSSFGLNDGPNWVGATGMAGMRYRFGAWVRSAASTGMIRLQVREYVNDVKVGSSTLSTPFALSPQWQLVWVDHVTQVAGSALDFQVQDSPVALGETFRIDEVSIHIIPADEPVAGSGDLEPPPEGPKLPGGGANDDDPGAHASNAFSARVVPAVTQSTAALQFTTVGRGALRVDLFDASGRHVRALLDDADVAPGLHSLNFDARDDHGDRLTSGVYFYRLQAAERSVAGRFVVVR